MADANNSKEEKSNVVQQPSSPQSSTQNLISESRNQIFANNLPLSHLQVSHLSLLEDCGSVSKSLYGNFVVDLENTSFQKQYNQLIVLRQNQTLEYYQICKNTQKIKLVCKYGQPGGVKISNFIKVSISQKYSKIENGETKNIEVLKDYIVVHVNPMKFITLEIDNQINEFSIVCMHNLSNDLRIQESGLLNPKIGFLQSFFIQNDGILPKDVEILENKVVGRPKKQDVITDENEKYQEVQSGFVFLADNTKLILIQFKMQLNEQIFDSINYENKFSQNDTLNPEYIDVLVPEKYSLQGDILRSNNPQNLLYPTQILDLNRIYVVPNPLIEFINSKNFLQKQSNDIISNEIYEQQMKEDSEQQIDSLIANMDNLLQNNLGQIDREIQSSHSYQQDMLANQNMKMFNLQISPPQKYQEQHIIQIKDLKIINNIQDKNNQVLSLTPKNSISLFVLHQVHLEKCTGTESKIPCFNVNVYSIDLNRSVYYTNQPQSQFKTPKILRNLSFQLKQCIQRLNYYTKAIISSQDIYQDTQMCQNDNEFIKNDLVYFISNISIYVFKQEKNTLTEVQTSTLCKVVQNLVQNERNLQKKLNLAQTQENIKDYRDPSKIVKCLTVLNTIDKQQQEIRFDKCTRVHALPNNRLMILMENQEKWVVHFRFDQADLEVAAVEFIPIHFKEGLNLSLVPSFLSVQIFNQNDQDVEYFKYNRNCLSFLVSISSYFHDQQIMILKPNFEDPIEDQQLQSEKRQRVSSSDNLQLQMEQGIKKKQQKNPIPPNYILEPKCQLTTISPITNIIELNHKTQKSKDIPQKSLLISSGGQQNGQLSLLYDYQNNSIAIESQKLIEIEGIEEVFSFNIQHLDNQLLFIVLTINSNITRILEFSERLTEIDYSVYALQEGFQIDQSTISIQKIYQNHVLQAVQDSLCIMEFYVNQENINMFKRIKEIKLEKIKKILDFNQKSSFILVIQDDGKLIYINSQSFEILQNSFQEQIIDGYQENEFTFLIDKNYFLIIQKNEDLQVQTVFKSSQQIINQPGLLFQSQQQNKQLYSSSDLTVPVSKDICADIYNLNSKFERFGNIFNSQSCKIIDIAVKQIDGIFWLFFLSINGRLIIYQSFSSQGFGFKIYTCSVLQSFQNYFPQTQSQIQMKFGSKYLYDEGTQIICMFQKLHENLGLKNQQLKTQNLVITPQNGRLLFNKLPNQEFSGLISHAKYQRVVKNAKQNIQNQYFLCVIKNQNDKQKSILSRAFRPPNQIFDPRVTSVQNPISNGVCIRSFPQTQQNSGIKAMCLHKGKYLIVASFQAMQTQTGPSNAAINLGFSPNLNNMAGDYKYSLDVYLLPSIFQSNISKDIQEIEQKQKINWKEMSNFQKKVFTYKNFQNDEIITSIESVSLDIIGALNINAKRMQQQSISKISNPQNLIAEKDEFLIVCSIKIDKKLEAIHYPSYLYVFQVIETQTTDSVTGKITTSDKLILLNKNEQKRLVSCIKSYKGHLISVKDIKQDYQIVLQSLKVVPFDESQCSEEHIYDQYLLKQTPLAGLRFFIDLDQQFPTSIQNMARFINIEMDKYIFIGDIYKSFQIFNQKTKAELLKEYIDDNTRISLKKRFQCKMDAYCIGVYTFEVPKQNLEIPNNILQDFLKQSNDIQVDVSYELKQTSILSASQDGSVRLYQIRDQKTIECIAQINIKDNILSILPIVRNKVKENHDQTTVTTQNRSFLIIPRRGSIIEVNLVSFQICKVIQMIAWEMSQLLPFSFGVTPAMNMQCGIYPALQDKIFAGTGGFQLSSKNLGMAPCSCLLSYNKSIRAYYELMERFDLGNPQSVQGSIGEGFLSNFSIENNVIDSRLVISTFVYSSLEIQKYISFKIGFQNLDELMILLNQI